MKFKQTNQICSPIKIRQSINVEYSACDRNNKGTYSSVFMKARNSLVVPCREREKTEDGENLFFKAVAIMFGLTLKNCSWFNKVGHDRRSFKWTS